MSGLFCIFPQQISGRGERIRTSDLSVPNRAHYQAVLRPETLEISKKTVPQGLHSKSRGHYGQARELPHK